jgi:hypothetical protein
MSVCRSHPSCLRGKVGAKKPIISSESHDRFQVDLIDIRSQRKNDVYGVTQCWIMTVKYQSTGLIHLSAFPHKKVKYVANKLKENFSFVGYPHIFDTDNIKEFITKTVVNLLMDIN